jgi:hypothetical protein
MDPACKFYLASAVPFWLPVDIWLTLVYRYNGTSDLQLERLNVYFNEVCADQPQCIYIP